MTCLTEGIFERVPARRALGQYPLSQSAWLCSQDKQPAIPRLILEAVKGIALKLVPQR